jgi:hypothetical protein
MRTICNITVCYDCKKETFYMVRDWLTLRTMLIKLFAKANFGCQSLDIVCASVKLLGKNKHKMK